MAVATAFKTASARIGKAFSPHSAKHCIGELGLKICKTAEEQVAWSMNMGHEDLEITRRYYQKSLPERVHEVFERFDSRKDEGFSEEDLKLMVLYHEHELVKGTPEFENAQRLTSEWRVRSDQG